MYNDVLLRFRTLIKKLSSTNKEFCDRIGIPEGTLKSLFQRDGYPTTELLIKSINVYPNISLEWILFGTGNMTNDDETKIGNNAIRALNAIENMNKKQTSKEEKILYKNLIDKITDLSGKLAVAEHKINELEKQLLQKSKTINDLEFRERGK